MRPALTSSVYIAVRPDGVLFACTLQNRKVFCPRHKHRPPVIVFPQSADTFIHKWRWRSCGVDMNCMEEIKTLILWLWVEVLCLVGDSAALRL